MVCRCDWWGHSLGSVQNGTRGESTGNLGGRTRHNSATKSHKNRWDITYLSETEKPKCYVKQFMINMQLYLAFNNSGRDERASRLCSSIIAACQRTVVTPDTLPHRHSFPNFHVHMCVCVCVSVLGLQPAAHRKASRGQRSRNLFLKPIPK